MHCDGSGTPPNLDAPPPPFLQVPGRAFDGGCIPTDYARDWSALRAGERPRGSRGCVPSPLIGCRLVLPPFFGRMFIDVPTGLLTRWFAPTSVSPADIWLRNMRFSKMIAGKIPWFWSDPRGKARLVLGLGHTGNCAAARWRPLELCANHSRMLTTMHARTCAQVRAWRRLLAKYDRDVDLLMIELVKGPLVVIWSLITCKSAPRSPAVAGCSFRRLPPSVGTAQARRRILLTYGPPVLLLLLSFAPQGS